MNKLAIFPGTFDPLTIGHMDIIKRAARIFPKIIIAVAASQGKNTRFNLNTRIKLVTDSIKDFSNVSAEGFSGMLVDYLKEKQARILIRGVRTVADYDYEIQLSGMYRALMPEVDIVMLPTSGAVSFISSTLVRDVILHQGDVSKFVPHPVNDFIIKQVYA